MTSENVGICGSGEQRRRVLITLLLQMSARRRENDLLSRRLWGALNHAGPALAGGRARRAEPLPELPVFERTKSSPQTEIRQQNSE